MNEYELTFKNGEIVYTMADTAKEAKKQYPTAMKVRKIS